MASSSATLPPPLLLTQRKSNLTSIQKLPFSLIRDKRNPSSITLIVKASGESSESSTDLNIVSSIQNVWDKSEDRLGLIGLSFAGIVALWASLNLITAIDKLPVISSGFELVGILFSTMVSSPTEWPAFAIYLEDIAADREEFSSFSLSYIKRSENVQADKLARHVRVLPQCVTYVNHILPN